MRAALAAAALVLFSGCVSLPSSGPDIGIIEDESLRAFLRPLALVEDQGCTLNIRGKPLAMRCRVFLGPAGERIVGVYDLVTDRPVVFLLLREDGTQEILWLPARRERTEGPEVVL